MSSVSVSEALVKRYSCRAYLDKPVPKDILDRIFTQAAHTPSNNNMQPWKVHVLMGDKKDELSKIVKDKTMEGKFHSKKGESFDFRVYPENLSEELWNRRVACGELMYESIGVTREDKMGRVTQALKNGDFFDAPVGLIITVDPCCEEGQLPDCGAFIQSLMLLAVEHGLATCPQQYWALWANTLREFLNTDDRVVVGLSLGYPDDNATINSVRQPRLNSEEFVHYV